jgi:2-dehydro-3-deoxyphosphogluconate aldolase/(4S)-4-hydroxy-2-oxoglutarate aldolase
MLRALLSKVTVVPVITLRDAAHAVPLAEALCAAGLTVLEVTLRTPAALAAIEAMRRAVPAAVVGAGTVVSAEQLAAAVGAGSQFLVSPGFSARLADAARVAGVPFLPGIATPTELMAALDAGLDTLKFFPAEQAGGVPMLKALYAPFPGARFCPTGGITPEKAPHYLAQPNVVAVGMSGVAPAELVEAGEFERITALARAAAGLRGAAR